MKIDSDVITAAPGDDMSVGRWFAFYAMVVACAAAVLVVLIGQHDWSWANWRGDFAGQLAATEPAVKLIIFGVYISLCCTFFPLPTSAVVAAVAMRDTAVGPDIFTTTLLVATIAALASTLANLNDYHLFTLILRHRKVARIRNTRLYDASAKWFEKSPFAILIIFNVLPIPVDVIRMLATTYRYPRVPFAAANFIGRFIRYAVIAYITYYLGRQYGWVAPVSLLALAVVLVITKFVTSKPFAKKTSKILFLISSLVITLAAARPQAPAVDTRPTQASPAGKTVRTILDQLEKAGKKYSAIRADLEYVIVNRKLGDSETRTGWIAYKSSAADKKSPAMFRIHFETLRQEGGPKIRDRVDYAFDGKWLTVKKHRIKQIIRYQVVADDNDKTGKKPEPLKLGKGPFPLPFSQKADEMLKHFQITTRPCDEDAPKNTDYLKLVPREKYKKKINFVRMEMWIDRKLHLPIKIICRDYSKNITTVKFIDISTPKDFGKADKKMFHLGRKPGWTYTEKPGVSH